MNVSHRDHGSNSGPSSPPMSYTLFSTGKITSTCSPFFTSLNCLTGNFKGKHTANFSYLAQSSQYGPCVNIGATVVTYSGDNDNLHNALYLAMYPKTGTPVTDIGQIWLVGHLKGKAHSRTYFHNYGDPMTNLAISSGGKPFISISSPSGGELIEQGSTYNIAWGDNIDGNVKIELLKGGTVVKEIAASTPSDGTQEWQVAPDLTAGADYKVKITSIDSTALFDMSNDNFTISPEYVIATFPYFEPFDTLDTNGTTLPFKYSQITTDELDWVVLAGPTPSKQYGTTGPDKDHTSGNGNYIYIEASSPNFPAKKAGFTTPKFNYSSLAAPKLSFWAHMFSDSNTMGDLYLDISVDGTWKNDVVHLTGDHGDTWFSQSVDLNQYKGQRVIFRFRGVTGTSYASDICIDDFRIGDETAIIHPILSKPSSFDLKYYNSRIYLEVPENTNASPVTIKLFNMQGKLVKTIMNKNVKPGSYSLQLENVSTGLYLCRMEAAGFKKAINVVISK